MIQAVVNTNKDKPRHSADQGIAPEARSGVQYAIGTPTSLAYSATRAVHVL